MNARGYASRFDTVGRSAGDIADGSDADPVECRESGGRMTCRRRLRLALATIVVAVLLVVDRCLFDGIGALLSFRGIAYVVVQLVMFVTSMLWMQRADEPAASPRDAKE
ncbi:hypothetical protein D2E24_0344 [Bifidobacterium samirii]|uniref:Uncharacterized protein n=2 Tax=Bifidobacterium samirii TaxID=2306974 RepID=A0A430FWH1_9BIFI|nr:hypothetical protein D2E24_0344 [Bifidobacterium samirii]